MLGRGVGVVLLLIAYLFLFLVQLDAANEAQGDRRADDAEHTERVGARIARGDGQVFQHGHGVFQGFLRRAEAGRVGHRAAEHAHHHRQVFRVVRVEHQIVEPEHHGDVEQHDAHGHEVHLDASPFERLEEAGSHLQTNAIHKEDQTEVLHEVQHARRAGVAPGRGVGDAARRVEMADDDAGEQDERDAQRDAAHLDLAQEHTHGNDYGENQHDMGHRACIDE